MKTAKADDYIQFLLNQWNEELGKHLDCDVITIKSPIRFGLDDQIRLEIEDLHENGNDRRNKLVVLLETTGGYIETVERIYNVFRQHYKIVDFIVPNYAYSAGTVLVLSGDNIYMDYYSVLGPIDPQYETDDGRLVPGLGYLQKFKELKSHINDKNKKPHEYRAELSILLQKFDPAILFDLEQARNHSISLLKEWLPRHKFKEWNETRSRKLPVDKKMREERAEQIGEVLSNPERWHSHGRGIGLKELTSDELKLEIINFGEDPGLNKLVTQYYDLLDDYIKKLEKNPMDASIIHTMKGIRRFYG